MLQAWPRVLARKSLQAREDLLIPAFENYFAENSLRVSGQQLGERVLDGLPYLP